MALSWKLVVDAHDPHLVADFWAQALGYLVEDNSVLINGLLAAGAIDDSLLTEHHGHPSWRTVVAVRHPDDPYAAETGIGLGRRILFQQVPEPKTAKNRLHIDVHAEHGSREAEVARLVALGAAHLHDVDDQGGQWSVLTDPEGNEFCVS
ncbi:hypothetical protein JGS22_004860 [Streptomyces sp. P38-E01]|uniref:Glyoxalase-like domain-containing protein n=1 Tax=Streptomyces tardus TaxID=2780544 RepID=A0A949JEG2_9ACTN|nr:VOC family protein [Streptomyces tardus]MBU7596984.1 hypothetical protein [Streptomyces tardus]